ncbi:MAG: AAA-like domain-containing protein [Verrucomicrobia bacterium]|nr:AAA-like domain-containing protein [Verrucomicrobiota bacterium]
MLKTKRFFNTVGAINPQDHYFIPHRLNWDQLTDFIEKKYYFILHAPRQSGKTTAIIEFVKHLNQKNDYKALYLSTEPAHSSFNDVKESVRAILEEFLNQITIFLPEEKIAVEYLQTVLKEDTTAKSRVSAFLRFWSQTSEKPVIIFFDEFDGLVGDTLVTFLKQFRTGYTNRPKNFPQTLCLIGVRDLRDYKVKTKEQEELGVLYSPFNIKGDSLILPDFSLNDVRTLYRQHTEDTGQIFTDEAIEYAFDQTQGQPWLVNALAYQACFRDVQDLSIPITLDIMEKAREALIKRCDTHMDALLDRLNEPRVLQIVDALISGEGENQEFSLDDLQYVQDLGLINMKGLCIANPIYKEIIPRTLSYAKQNTITQETFWYQKEDGSLDINKLLQAFTLFYRENSEVWLERFAYKESGPHLLLLAFIQRIINGGGTIHREYALGRKRADLLITWKTKRFVIELKINRGKDPIPEGLEQTASYMDKTGATEGHLVIFDRSPTKTWEEKIFHKIEKVQEKTIEVWGM